MLRLRSSRCAAAAAWGRAPSLSGSRDIGPARSPTFGSNCKAVVGRGGPPMKPVARPLSGVRVVDFTANMSGPMTTMILGDQGADVVKVEPLGGDIIRVLGTGTLDMSAFFGNLNRSKR